MGLDGEGVIIIGAGPVGLFTALLLAKAGVKVTVFESADSLSQAPRAIAFFPVILHEFEKAGILPDVLDAGQKNFRGWDWRAARSGEVLAGVTPPPHLVDSSFAVHLGQNILCEILTRRLSKTGNCEVVFNHAFLRAEEKDGVVTAFVERKLDGQTLSFKARYLVGADGGRSTVRRSLGIALEGFTWEDVQLIAVNLIYDLDKYGWKSANFLVDPEYWAVVVKRGPGHAWRVATSIPRTPNSEDKPLDTATLLSIIKERVTHILPGNTEDIIYLQVAPYVIHQRCAAQYHQGNIVLAGDAAHLNNPIGGLGLTTGILDAAHLAATLKRILLEKADPASIADYSNTRRKIFLERTSPTSEANLLRLKSLKPEHLAERKDLFARLNDPNDIKTKRDVGGFEYSLSTTLDIPNGPPA